jgi:tRNA(Glu) U13 pseudouridine synthase TruD
LLQGKWVEAIDQILMPRACENEAATKARRIYQETGNPEKALEILPRFMHVEKLLLFGIKDYGKVCVDYYINYYYYIKVNLIIEKVFLLTSTQIIII